MRKLNLLTIGAVERTALVLCALAVLWLAVVWALT
jgi:hypothetical protein